MLGVFSAFRSAEFLDTERHKDIRIKIPKNFSFCEDVDVAPLGFSELLWVSMYYPVLFGIFEGEVFPFAVMGLGQKNFYLSSEGQFKVDVIPSVVKLYPFSVVRTKGEDSKRQWTVVYDKSAEDEEGERLFDEEGKETEFFSSIKSELERLAYDFEDALIFSKELIDTGCLKLLQSFHVDTRKGQATFKNVFIGDVENLSKISPERLYYLNSKGYLPILYSIYFSVRNFKLFDLI